MQSNKHLTRFRPDCSEYAAKANHLSLTRSVGQILCYDFRFFVRLEHVGVFWRGHRDINARTGFEVLKNQQSNIHVSSAGMSSLDSLLLNVV